MKWCPEKVAINGSNKVSVILYSSDFMFYLLQSSAGWRRLKESVSQLYNGLGTGYAT